MTVFDIELTSALKVPPQMRSSHVFDCGRRSATRAHPINSQSFMHEFGVPWVPPPTMAFTATLLLPDRVNERDRFESVCSKMFIIRTIVQSKQINITYLCLGMLYIGYYRNFVPIECKYYNLDSIIGCQHSYRNWNFSHAHKRRYNTVNSQDRLSICLCIRFVKHEYATSAEMGHHSWWAST